MFWQHPAWAVAEIAPRLRTARAPREGVRQGKIGEVAFTFDFALDPVVIREMYAGAYDTSAVHLMRRILRPGDTFVDVGANIGYLSAMAASLVGPKGRVISFEPSPTHYQRALANQQLNPEYRWEVHPIALGREEGTAELVVNSDMLGWNSMVPGQLPEHRVAERVTVPVRRLDECLEEFGVERVRILKIDVEGYEEFVLAGVERTLERGVIDHLMVEISPFNYEALGTSVERLMERMQRCGYRAREIRSPHRPLRAEQMTGRNMYDVWFSRSGRD
jgi:FkbM family methyltransferase